MIEATLVSYLKTVDILLGVGKPLQGYYGQGLTNLMMDTSSSSEISES